MTERDISEFVEWRTEILRDYARQYAKYEVNNAIQEKIIQDAMDDEFNDDASLSILHEQHRTIIAERSIAASNFNNVDAVLTYENYMKEKEND